MAEPLALFPLSTVLFPGIPLPLHIFEERYRLLMRELLERDEPRRFGVVAIRHGREVADDEAPLLYDVGCVAEVRHVEHYADGRLDVVTMGGPRFRLVDTDDSRPFLRGAVDYLRDEPGEGIDGRAVAVGVAFARYVATVAELRDEQVQQPALPDDPALLSYLVAAAVQVDLPEKQQLLECADTSTRLRAELSLLRREHALLRSWIDGKVEVPTIGPFSLN
jgi:Lon protease-like protein